MRVSSAPEATPPANNVILPCVAKAEIRAKLAIVSVRVASATNIQYGFTKRLWLPLSHKKSGAGG